MSKSSDGRRAKRITKREGIADRPQDADIVQVPRVFLRNVIAVLTTREEFVRNDARAAIVSDLIKIADSATPNPRALETATNEDAS